MVAVRRGGIKLTNRRPSRYGRCGRPGCGGCLVEMATYKLAGSDDRVAYLYCWKCRWRPAANKRYRPAASGFADHLVRETHNTEG